MYDLELVETVYIDKEELIPFLSKIDEVYYVEVQINQDGFSNSEEHYDKDYKVEVCAVVER